MRYTLKNAFISYSLDEQARVCSIINVRLGHEYCHAPGELFRLLYQIGDFDERPIMTSDQATAEITVSGTRDARRSSFPPRPNPAADALPADGKTSSFFP